MDAALIKLSQEIGELLKSQNLTLSTAESCTAGRIAAAITAVSGSSMYFKGSVVSYCNEIKRNVLGVSDELLETKGAVSKEVACAMHEGILKVMNTDCAIAITGFAGPLGGKEAPVGTIWIAVGNKKEIEVKLLQVDKEREENLTEATISALQLLLNFLKNA